MKGRVCWDSSQRQLDSAKPIVKHGITIILEEKTKACEHIGAIHLNH